MIQKYTELFPETPKRCELTKLALFITPCEKRETTSFYQQPFKHQKMASPHVSPTRHLEITSQLL